MADPQYCVKCGTPRPAEAGFCVKCGEKFVGAIPVEEKKAVAKEKVVKREAKSPRKLSVLAIGLLLVGLIAGYGLSWAYHPVVADLTNERDDLRTQLLETRDALSDLDTSHNQLQAVYDSVETELAEAKANIVGLTAEIDSLTVVRDQLSTDIADLNGTISILEQEEASLRSALETERSEKASLETDLQVAQNLLDQAQTDLTSKQSEFTDLNRQITSLTSERDSLQRDHDLLAGRFEALKENFDLVPQARSQYNLLDPDGFYHFLEAGGNYQISPAEDRVFLFFPDIRDCLSVGRILATGSMRPLFGGGHELLKTTCFERTDIRQGDIITFTEGGISIVHQVIDVRSEGVITKGVANEVNDGLVRWDQITSIVVAVVF